MMIKGIFAFLCVIFAYASSYGQDKPTTFIWSEKNLKEIGCSDEQIVKIMAIKKNAVDARGKVMADASLPEKEMKLQRGKILKDRNAAIMQLLSAEQQSKVKEAEKKLREEAGK